VVAEDTVIFTQEAAAELVSYYQELPHILIIVFPIQYPSVSEALVVVRLVSLKELKELIVNLDLLLHRAE
jgi:hypothetical protein